MLFLGPSVTVGERYPLFYFGDSSSYILVEFAVVSTLQVNGSVCAGVWLRVCLLLVCACVCVCNEHSVVMRHLSSACRVLEHA